MKNKQIFTILAAAIIVFSVLTFAHAPDGEKTEFCAVSDFEEASGAVTPPEREIAFVEPVCPEETIIVAAPEPEPIVIEEASPPTNQPPTAPPSTEQIESGTRTVDGQQQLYVPGFGWMDNEGGGTIQIIVGSEGSIDKMVGSMGGEPTDNCPND